MLIELNKISKHYENPQTKKKQLVLNELSFGIKKGDSIAIVGPSGSGKTTLLNIIGTLDQPSSGEVKFKGDEMNQFKEKQLAKIRNLNIGFIFQSHHLLPQLNLLENILLPTIPNKNRENNKEIIARAISLLKTVGLEDKTDHLSGQLSGGESQRAAVVRALINKPELILADEPTGSLDAKNASQTGELLSKINKEHKVAIIVVTHSLELAEKMKIVYTLKNGKLELYKK